MNIERFKKKPVMGILRGIDEDIVEPLIECVIASGLETIEITMNTTNAPLLIKKAIKSAKDSLMIGAGTVLKLDDLKKALDAGATFIVSPTLVPEVIVHCLDNNIPVFPGAFTPQEIYNCMKAGATMVKVFPSKFCGPDYIKEIKGPFQDIQLMACGGVNKETIKDFFSNGASAVAIGGSIFRKEWLQQKDFSSIENSIKELLSKI